MEALYSFPLMYIHLFHSSTGLHTVIHTYVAIFNVNLVERSTVYMQKCVFNYLYHKL